MTLRLILTRHAKSEWDDPFEDDRARPLNDRGRAAAQAIGAWLAAEGYVPDSVLCSDARRTTETWALVSKAFSEAPAVSYSNRLYHASAKTLLEILQGASGNTVMIIGHNPGIADFAAALVDHRPGHPRFTDYPTCATTIIDFEANDWSQVHPGLGSVVAFTVPRDLIDD